MLGAAETYDVIVSDLFIPWQAGAGSLYTREQFELKTHKRLIDILDSRAQTIDALTKMDLPAGVDVEVKVQ